MKYTGEEFSKLLGINVIEPKGWNSVESFNSDLISKEEFLLRASTSIIDNKNISRKEMAELKKKLK